MSDHVVSDDPYVNQLRAELESVFAIRVILSKTVSEGNGTTKLFYLLTISGLSDWIYASPTWQELDDVVFVVNLNSLRSSAPYDWRIKASHEVMFPQGYHGQTLQEEAEANIVR